MLKLSSHIHFLMLACFHLASSAKQDSGRTPCKYGELKGEFRDKTWHLHTQPSSSCRLNEIISRREGPKKIGSCKRQSSVLAIGDSVDRDAIQRACNHFGAEFKPYVKLTTKLRGKNSYNFCHIPELNVTLGQFMNFGVFKEPYWKFAYPIPSEFHVDNVEHIRLDAANFSKLLPDGQPTIVIVQSYLWDLAREWMVRGKLKRYWQPEPGFVHQWFARVKKLLAVVKDTFPSSKVMWRTAPPPKEGEDGRNNRIIHSMNEIMRSYASHAGLEIIDYGSMLQGMSPEKSFATHPGIDASLAYMNVLLNCLFELCGT